MCVQKEYDKMRLPYSFVYMLLMGFTLDIGECSLLNTIPGSFDVSAYRQKNIRFIYMGSRSSFQVHKFNLYLKVLLKVYSL